MDGHRSPISFASPPFYLVKRYTHDNVGERAAADDQPQGATAGAAVLYEEFFHCKGDEHAMSSSEPLNKLLTRAM
jgi:hypothetical protein